MSAAFSTTATTLRHDGEDCDVLVTLDAPTKKIQPIRLLIPNIRGDLISLRYLANIKEEPGSSLSLQYKKTITISAEIDKKTTVNLVNKSIQERIKTILDTVPSVQFSEEGEGKDSIESIKNLGFAFILSLVFIYFIILSLFNRISDPLLIVGYSVCPLGFLSRFLHREPISFMMLMGSIGMTGVVVNNSIILVHIIQSLKSDVTDSIRPVIDGSVNDFVRSYNIRHHLIGIISYCLRIGGKIHL